MNLLKLSLCLMFSILFVGCNGEDHQERQLGLIATLQSKIPTKNTLMGEFYKLDTKHGNSVLTINPNDLNDVTNFLILYDDNDQQMGNKEVSKISKHLKNGNFIESYSLNGIWVGLHSLTDQDFEDFKSILPTNAYQIVLNKCSKTYGPGISLYHYEIINPVKAQDKLQAFSFTIHSSKMLQNTCKQALYFVNKKEVYCDDEYTISCQPLL